MGYWADLLKTLAVSLLPGSLTVLMVVDRGVGGGSKLCKRCSKYVPRRATV